MITIYHNPRCGKSREALKIVEASDQAFTIREYLKVPLSKEELKALAQKLSLKPLEMMRTKEPLFIEKYKEKVFSDEDYFDAMAKNPILMERAIVETSEKAVIARPPQKVMDIL